MQSHITLGRKSSTIAYTAAQAKAVEGKTVIEALASYVPGKKGQTNHVCGDLQYALKGRFVILVNKARLNKSQEAPSSPKRNRSNVIFSDGDIDGNGGATAMATTASSSTKAKKKRRRTISSNDDSNDSDKACVPSTVEVEAAVGAPPPP